MKQLEKTGKRLFLIQTFMDEAEMREKIDIGEKFEKSKMKKEIHEHFHEMLKINEADIFLISNGSVDGDNWDFDKLARKISVLRPTSDREWLKVLPADFQQLAEIFAAEKVDEGKSNLDL